MWKPRGPFTEDSKNCLGKNKGVLKCSPCTLWPPEVPWWWWSVWPTAHWKKTVSHLKSCQRITLQYKVIEVTCFMLQYLSHSLCSSASCYYFNNIHPEEAVWLLWRERRRKHEPGNRVAYPVWVWVLFTLWRFQGPWYAPAHWKFKTPSRWRWTWHLPVPELPLRAMKSFWASSMKRKVL